MQFTVAQTIEKKVFGCWTESFWEFEFFENGAYKRTSSGHYGNTIITGLYTVVNDTIQIKSGFEDSDGTINKYYIIDKNNVLIDTKLENGYLMNDEKQTTLYCDLKYPKITAVNKEKIIQLEKAINLAFNSDKMKAYYHFDTKPKRKLLVSKYHALQANIIVDHKVAEFRAIEEITEDFYIEFEDFNLNYSDLNFTIKIHDEGVKIDFTFILTDKEWVIKETRIFEE